MSMPTNKSAKIIAIFLIICTVLAQSSVLSIVIFQPQTALAQGLDAGDIPIPVDSVLPSTSIGTGDALSLPGAVASVPIAQIVNVPSTLDAIFTNLMRGIAFAIVQKVSSVFISRLTAKYKIQNYLYYDQVLTNYYLTNFISDKISDPDLKRIYSLLYAGYVSGTPTGLSGQPSPTSALVPQLKQAITNYYIKQGGIDPNNVYNPAPGVTDTQYFQTAQAYYANPPSFTQQNLQGQYGAFQSNSTTAAQLEVIVGNSLKAGRVIGGTCKIPADWGMDASDYGSPDACAAIGGTWQPSALDQARSFIQNPTLYLNTWLQSFISNETGTNFNPTNFWYVIGGSLGNYLLNSLINATSNDAPLNENPNAPYVAPNVTVNTSPGTPVDIDGDGVTDAYADANGVITTCLFGGTAPSNCVGSKSLLGPPATPIPCTPLGQDEQNFMDPLLNALPQDNPLTSPPSQSYQTSVQNIVDQTNTQFASQMSAAGEGGPEYYPANDTIGFPEFYLAGPLPNGPTNWGPVSRCVKVPLPAAPVPVGPERPACTQLGYNEQQFITPLLNGLSNPSDQTQIQSVIDQTNSTFATQMQAAGETGGLYYPTNNVIGFPEFYMAGPLPGGPTNWGPVPVCPAT